MVNHVEGYNHDFQAEGENKRRNKKSKNTKRRNNKKNQKRFVLMYIFSLHMNSENANFLLKRLSAAFDSVAHNIEAAGAPQKHYYDRRMKHRL